MPTPARAAPSSWIEQYDVKLQLVGRDRPDCEFETEGGIDADRFLGLPRIGESVVGAVGWNMPKQLAAVARSIGTDARPVTASGDEHPPTSCKDSERNAMRITIDEGRCIGAGNCVMAAPAVFDQREDDGVVVVIDDDPDESQRDDVVRAVQACPAAVIQLAE